MLKLLIERWKAPTPEKWKKIGNALLRTSVYLSASSIIAEHNTFALFVLAMGGIGDFIVNFSTEEQTQ